VDLDHLAVKIRCQSPPLLERFNALPFDRKVAFSNTAGLDAIHVPDWNWDTALERTLARFDLVEWLKQPGSAVARRGVRAYLRSLWTR
jgi:hypothetical protein